jgi:signal transduction histidine kinase
MMQAMACLGGRAELSLLQAATGEPPGAVDQALAPALGDGLLVAEAGTDPAVRFRHDRIREVILGGLGPERRRALQLGMARRLAVVPELFAVAAGQYLPVADAIDDAAERRRVVGLLRRGAGQATLTGDYALVNALLTAGLRLIDPGDTGTLVEVHTARHASLYGLGRLEEADEEYRTIEELGPTVLDRPDATVVQVDSLTNRNRFTDAMGLGLDSLRELGITVPAAGRLSAELDRQFGHLYRWLEDTKAADDLARPEITDPVLLAASRLLDAILPVAYYADPSIHAWLSLEAVRIWLGHGPGRALAGPAGIAAFAAAVQREDYSAGYRAARRIVAFCEARRYEPETSLARYVFSLLSCWFEPIETGVQAARRARQGLVAGADMVYAGYAYHTAVSYLLDCAPSLDDGVAEVEAGLAFTRRTGNDLTGQAFEPYRWLADALRGDSADAAGEPVPATKYAGNPSALFYTYLARAIAAAIFGDQAALSGHAAAAMPLVPTVSGGYQTAVVQVLRGLALAGQARGDSYDQRGGLLSELDEVTQWLAARAADAPDNFLHLLRLTEAERAWAAGDFLAAAVAFDTARREAASRQRPWHRALIIERAARFHLAHGLDQAGYDLLAQARQEYLAWGATAKVAQLDWAYPTLRPGAETTAGLGAGQSADPPQGRSSVTTGTIDLLGILSASQALSSQTSIERLHARVAQVLSAMTGATGVHLVLWDNERHSWQLPAPGGGTAPVSGTGHETAIPLSVLRYAQRTGERLVVNDATQDDRFTRDPYFTGVGCCSLLALPVLSRGLLRAVLLLENRLLRGAFTSERLDTVQLIVGQLAVSLDNAQLYTELTTSRARIVATADQTRRRIERDLHDGAQQRLVTLALQLRAAQATVPPELGELGAHLDRAVAEATGALDDLRELARGIHPAILADGGLRPALRTLARRSAVPVSLAIRTDSRLPEHVEISAYYVVAEALTNAAKHARATAVTVEAEVTGDVLHLTIRDDGAGGADLNGGTGLAGLRDRVEALGGRIVLHSPRGAGTSLRAEVPLTTANADVYRGR